MTSQNRFEILLNILSTHYDVSLFKETIEICKTAKILEGFDFTIVGFDYSGNSYHVRIRDFPTIIIYEPREVNEEMKLVLDFIVDPVTSYDETLVQEFKDFLSDSHLCYKIIDKHAGGEQWILEIFPVSEFFKVFVKIDELHRKGSIFWW